MSKTKTVKCRIALAVDPKGEWSAGGYSGQKGDPFYGVCDSLDQGEARYFVEVDVPVPQVVVVNGKLTEQPGAAAKEQA